MARMDMECAGWDKNPLSVIGGQASCVLVVAHLFQLILKLLGQPPSLAQILAGFVLGPSLLSRIPAVRNTFSAENSGAYFKPLGVVCRIIFLFLIGLEVDAQCLARNLRPAASFALGTIAMSTVFAAALVPFVRHLTDPTTNVVTFVTFFTMAVSNTAAPLVIRVTSDLRISTSNVGRLAVFSALINDMLCMVLQDISNTLTSGDMGGRLKWGLLDVLLVGSVVFLSKRIVGDWVNNLNRNEKYIKNVQLLCILSCIIAVAMVIESKNFLSPTACIFIGMMFPKGGKTARTLLHKLNYSVHIFVLPIYFGYVGIQADFTQLRDLKGYTILVLVALSSVGGKVCGTLAACRYQKIPLSDVAILPFLLSLKGHVDLLILKNGIPNVQVLLYSIMVNNILVTDAVMVPFITFIAGRDKSLAYTHVPLEKQCSNPQSELRALGCTYGPRHVPTMAWLLGASTGSRTAPGCAYLIHLIELPEKAKTNLTYHQLEQDELSDEDDYGGNDVVEVNEALDSFVSDTKLMVRQLKVVSPMATMYEDVSEAAVDVRASIVILPFHKHRRIDGKMEKGKEAMRTINQKVLRHAPCTVAILVDRGLACPPQVRPSIDTVQHVATLFFGGPDDREALAYSLRLSLYPQINVTVIRFTSSTSDIAIDNASNSNEEVLMQIDETKNEADNAFVADFYNRYVTTGQVGYVERSVDSGGDTCQALRDMGEMYSLFVVGKGRRGQSPMTTGMSDWEECPELGAVGDLLASAEFDVTGSVLVIQRHMHSDKDPGKDRNAISGRVTCK